MDLTKEQEEELLVEILRKPELAGILNDLNNKTDWWMRVTKNNPPLREIISGYYISCLY
jgi:hypothetical protein